MSSLGHTLRWLWRQHFIGSLGIVVFTSTVMALQVSNRTDFASNELAHDVESRWGAPVEQAAPSVRAVQSGTVFTELSPLTLSQQHVNVTATMNYRKRGLAYFSGFDFVFDGSYLAAAAYAFCTVLMSYLGAFVHFFAAWGLTVVGLGAAVVLYTGRLFPHEKRTTLIGVWVATQVLPTFAVLLPGYTGLIYTLELLALLLAAMTLMTRSEVRALLSDVNPEDGAA